MNRDIKFRGFSFEKKEFVFGCYTEHQNFINLKKYIKTNKKGQFIWLEVDDESVGQYTGLKDKNGTKIYEGDIMSKVHINELGKIIQYYYVVIWSSSDVGFVCKQYILDENEDGEYWRLKNDLFDSLIMVKTYNHVIGNIFENPELINKTK